VRAWESGELPVKDAVAQLQQLHQDALNANHLANQGRAEHLMGYLQHYRGNLDVSIRHYERARALYLRVGNRVRAAAIDLNQGENYRFKGDFARARRLYRAAYDAATELNELRIQTIALVNEGLVLLATGQYDDARAAFQEGYQLACEWPEPNSNLYGILCEVHHGMATIHMHAHQHSEAWEEALRGLETASQSKQPFHLGFANRIMGEVVTALGGAPEEGFSADPDDYFRAALEAFREVNAEAELARTMFAQAKSLSTRGRRTTAARKLQQAMIIFTQLGMVDDAARAAEAQLAVL
jgi:tetratricopeptide (TPR) repeat protein